MFMYRKYECDDINDCQVGHLMDFGLLQDGIDDINSVYNLDLIGNMGAISMPQSDGNAILRLLAFHTRLFLPSKMMKLRD